jgi:hypothetical protein
MNVARGALLLTSAKAYCMFLSRRKLLATVPAAAMPLVWPNLGIGQQPAADDAAKPIPAEAKP